MNRICMFTLFLIACDGEDKTNTTDTADVQTEPNDTGEATDTNEQDDT